MPARVARAKAAAEISTPLERRLSPAERLVLRELLTGAGNIAIARRLRISDKTVKNHLAHIFAKTSCRTRLELIVKIFKHRVRVLQQLVKANR